jgi:membrane fusion protein, copper/silver efflux system
MNNMENPGSGNALRQAQAALKKRWQVPALLIAVVLLFLVGSWYGQRKAFNHKATGDRPILHYVDPMNPSHTSPEPGLAPCGMKMEPVYADEEGQTVAGITTPGTVKITSEKQQIIGVRLGTVEKSPWTYTLRTVGKVAVDDTRIYRLNAFTEGFVVKVYDNSTGSLVRKDEPLATLYSKDLLKSLQSFLYAYHAAESMKAGEGMPPSQNDALEAQKRFSEGSLMNLGMGKMQMEELARTRQLTQEISLNAPATSFVLVRNVTPGQKFNTGDELYRLADLSRVWVLADLFENEAKYIRPGEKVKVRLNGQEEAYMATVSEILPQFDPATLTLKARLELDNPKFTLRPGMFTDIEFPIHLPPSVNIPVDAVMDSGLKKIVFVERDQGFFEPRKVKTGWRLGDRVEILEGLQPGERIVISGNFLIDSESRMKLAAAGMFGEVTKDPVCGLNVDESKAKAAGFQKTFNNQTYYFCSQGCQQHFDKNPERYAGKTGEGQQAPVGTAGSTGEAKAVQVKDPVCGHEVGVEQAKAGGLTSDYKGKTYYFCSYSCNRQFDKTPERYVGKAEGGPDHGGAVSSHKPPAVPSTVKDPVCGLEVTTGPAKQAGLTSEYQGKTYYFDTPGCKQRFDRAPQRYLAASGEAPFPERYPDVPTDPNQLLRLRRDFQRSIAPWKGQDTPSDPDGIRPQEHKTYPQAPPTPQAPKAFQAPPTLQAPQAPQPSQAAQGPQDHQPSLTPQAPQGPQNPQALPPSQPPPLQPPAPQPPVAPMTGDTCHD